MKIPVEKYRRMEAALKNILEVSREEFSRSQAKWGLGIKDENKDTIVVDQCNDFNFD